MEKEIITTRTYKAIISFVVFILCILTQTSFAQNSKTNSVTRALYPLTGEKNPYVGDSCNYSLRLDEKLEKPLKIIINTGVRGFIRVGGKGSYKNSSLQTEIPKDATTFNFEVIWDRESSGNSITLTSIQGQDNDVSAELLDINVRMRPWEWTAPSSVSLNKEFTISCSYSSVKGSNIEPYWDYDHVCFEKIFQTTDPAKKETSLTLLPRKGGNAKIELSFAKNITYDYGLIASIDLGSKSTIYQIEEPDISGNPIIDLYETSIYSISGDGLRDIVWSGENIKIIGENNTPQVTVVATKEGQGSIEVSYHIGDTNKDFKKQKDLTINNVIMQIDGKDMVCNQEVFTIKNFQNGATVDWEVRDTETGELLLSKSNQTSSALTVSSSLNTDEDSKMVDILATVHYNTLNISLRRNVALVKSGIQEAGAYTITGSYGSTGGMFEVSPRPYDATGYRWSVDNGWAADVNDQFFCSFYSMTGEPYYGPFHVTVSFSDPCGNWLTVHKEFSTEARFMLSSNPVAYSLEIKDEPDNTSPRSIRKIKVFTQMGMPVLETDYPADSRNVHVDVSSLPEGNYVLQVFDGTKWEQHKLIINR